MLSSKDFVIDKSIDLICMSETLLNDIDSAFIIPLTPESTFYITFLAPIIKVAELVASLTNHYSLGNSSQKAFESMEVQLSIERKKFILNVIYRPPHCNFSLILQETESLTLESEINEADVIYLGDFNIRKQ